MELQPNMHVRTEEGIYKINYFINNNYTQKFTYIDNKGVSNILEEKEIIKASHNIIDLIEVGDVITTNNLCGEVTKIDIENNEIWIACCDYETCRSEDIKSIVTKEQFESMSYKVGE